MRRIVEKFRDTRFALIVILGVGAILLLVVFALGSKERTVIVPNVLYTVPQNGASGVNVVSVLGIKFDRAVDLTNLTIELSPVVKFEDSLEEQNSILLITPKTAFSYDTFYTIRIADKKSGKQIVSFSFRTETPKGDAQSLDQEKTQKDLYPLAPYDVPNGAHFYFQYTGPLTIKVILRGNAEAAKQEFEAWVKGLGVDLSKHKIEFTNE